MGKNFSEFTKEDLWKLRKEVNLGSVFLGDYKNSFGIYPNSVHDFFDGYLAYLWELYTEEHGNENADQYDVVCEYDNAENLYNWYGCFDDFDWVEYYD